MIANPIIVFFKLPRPVQNYVEILSNESNPLVFQCTIESRGRDRNVLDSSKLEEINPIESEELNGSRDTVITSLSRNRLSSFGVRPDEKSAAENKSVSQQKTFVSLTL